MASSTTGSISSLVDHFTNSAGSLVAEGAGALARADLSGFKATAEKIGSLEITKLIVSKLTTSSQTAESFATQASLATGLQFLSGAVMAGTGAYALANAAAIATGIGFVTWAGTAIVVILSITLLLYGISRVHKSLLKKAEQTLDLASLVDP